MPLVSSQGGTNSHPEEGQERDVRTLLADNTTDFDSSSFKSCLCKADTTYSYACRTRDWCGGGGRKKTLITRKVRARDPIHGSNNATLHDQDKQIYILDHSVTHNVPSSGNVYPCFPEKGRFLLVPPKKKKKIPDFKVRRASETLWLGETWHFKWALAKLLGRGMRSTSSNA